MSGLAKLTPLTDIQNLMRHVSFARLRKDEHDNVIGFLYSAFEIQSNDDALSAAWVEFAQLATHDENIAATKAAFGRAITIRKNSRFAVGNVGDIRAVCVGQGQKVRISHEPEPNFPEHATVRQIDTGALELIELLATEAWAQIHSIV